LDCDVPGGSVRFTPLGDDGVTMNLDLPEAALADTPFAGLRIVSSVSLPSNWSLQFGVWDSGLMASAEARLKSPAGGALSVMVNNDEVIISDLLKKRSQWERQESATDVQQPQVRIRERHKSSSQ
jgi:hypothetical protein